MEELKRCPFCGSIPTLYHDGLHQVDSKRRYHTTWMILCEKCHNASMSNSAYYSFGEDGVLSPYDEKDGRQEIIKPERKTDTVPSQKSAWHCMSLHSPQERWW